MFSSFDGWAISLVLNDAFLFGPSLDLILAGGSQEDVDRVASAESYRRVLETTLSQNVFPGARVEVVIAWGDTECQHCVDARRALSHLQREEMADRLYRTAYEVWNSLNWVVWRRSTRPTPEVSA